MRICDGCKKPLPLGTSDCIEVNFRGKFGDFVKKIHGASHLDFCSLECYDKFRIADLDKKTEGGD